MKLNKKNLILIITSIIILITLITILVTTKNNTNTINKNPDLSTITNNSDIDEIVVDKKDIIQNEQTEKDLENSNISTDSDVPIENFKNQQNENSVETKNSSDNITNDFNTQKENNNNSQINQVNSYYNENDNKEE